MDNDDPRFPSSRFLRVACVIFPKGSPPPPEWLAAHPQYLRVPGFFTPRPPSETDTALEPRPEAEGQLELLQDVGTYEVVIDYAGNWTVRPVEPLTPQPAPWTEPQPEADGQAEPQPEEPIYEEPAPEPEVEPEPPPRPDYLRCVPPPGPRRARGGPPALGPNPAARGMDPLAPEFTHTLVRKAMQAIAGMDRVTRPGGIATDEGLSAAVRAGMQHLAAHKGDVRAALAAAKAAGARWTDSVAEVAIPANAEAANPGMHREPATPPEQPHSLAERQSEPRAVWHGVVPISPRHPTEPITRFVSHYPLAELAILGTESVGFGPKNAVTAGGAGAAIEPAEDAAEVAPKKAAEGVAENAARRNRSIPPLPDKNAEGRPHSTVQRPGPRGRYTTYDEHGPIKQYRGEPGPGEPHGQPRPNVKEWPRNVAPDGRTYPGTPRVRQPTPDEIPGEPPVAPGPQIGPEESPEIEFPF